MSDRRRSLCYCVFRTVIFTHRFPAHPVPVLILHPTNGGIRLPAFSSVRAKPKTVHVLGNKRFNYFCWAVDNRTVQRLATCAATLGSRTAPNPRNTRICAAALDKLTFPCLSVSAEPPFGPRIPHYVPDSSR